MSKLIATLSIQGTLPTITNGVKNINRYQSLKAFFRQKNAYRIFAEPFYDPTGKFITWQTDWEYSGSPRALHIFTDEEQARHRSLIKKQAVGLYLAANELQNRFPNKAEYKDLSLILRDCLEIPADVKANIFVLNVPDEHGTVHERYVITQWAHLEDVENPRRRIIERWLSLQPFDIAFRCSYANGIVATGERFELQYQKMGSEGFKTIELVSDTDGMAEVAEVKPNTTMQLKWLRSDEADQWEQQIMRDERQEYEVVLPQPTSTPTRGPRTLYFTYVNNLKEKIPVPDVAVSFPYNGTTFTQTTDGKGKFQWPQFPFEEKKLSFTTHYENRTGEGRIKIVKDCDQYIIYPKRPWWIWWLWGLLGLLALLLLAWLLRDCSGGTIFILRSPYSVIVKDDSSRVALPDVEVRVITPKDTLLSRTDGNGQVTIDAQKGDTVAISLQKEGYNDSELVAVVQTERDTTVYLQKQPEMRKMEGQTGDIRVNLQWNTTDDLDLHLRLPNGQRVNYQAPRTQEGDFFAELDIDANDGVQAAPAEGIIQRILKRQVAIPEDLTQQPQENIRCESPMAGIYQVVLINYAPRTKTPVKYNIYLKVGDREEIFSGTIEPVAKKEILIKEFTITAQ
ncbi:hypothetical protein [Runella sp.]|uniref:hypothetical protein n=1 Tax=Runella sp. TaxID=1960881 RepID=UPI0030179A7B